MYPQYRFPFHQQNFAQNQLPAQPSYQQYLSGQSDAQMGFTPAEFPRNDLFEFPATPQTGYPMTRVGTAGIPRATAGGVMGPVGGVPRRPVRRGFGGAPDGQQYVAGPGGYRLMPIQQTPFTGWAPNLGGQTGYAMPRLPGPIGTREIGDVRPRPPKRYV